MDKYQQILKEQFGYDSFRGIQREIIEDISNGKDTLGLMPTGGGKSITFQVPALAQEGVCLVITPLIALMKDQVEHLRHKGILAAAIHSGLSRNDVIRLLENCILGHMKFLYISPERLSSELFLVKLKRIPVSFITVDEAHCISQWGYDFRPSYLDLVKVRAIVPHAPVLALTATATPKVIEDIQDKLNFACRNVHSMSFERKNLAYIVRETPDKLGELIHILRSVTGSAIVYTRSRQRTKEVSEYLQHNEISATHYHAGLDHAVKSQRQDDWQHDKVRVIVATNAFGMGIDKPDVRLVIHLDCPSSIESYFQEAGRAGRDGAKAYAVLLFNSHDTRILDKRIEDTFPPKEYVKEVYEDLAYSYQIGVGSGAMTSYTFNMDAFCKIYKHFPVRVRSALHLLEQAKYIEFDEEPDNASRVVFLLGSDELYLLDNLAPHEKSVVNALLRNYGGLFTNYVYIDERLLSIHSGLTNEQVYANLKSLSRRRILHFIPRRKVPRLTYTQNREATSRIKLSADIYEKRKEQFIKRINAMKHYATNHDFCRSRLLLRYFGEERSADCGKCDVCLGSKQKPAHTGRHARAQELIMQLLSDGEPHLITQIKALPLPTDEIEDTIEHLLQEEKIVIDGTYLKLSGAD